MVNIPIGIPPDLIVEFFYDLWCRSRRQFYRWRDRWST